MTKWRYSYEVKRGHWLTMASFPAQLESGWTVRIKRYAGSKSETVYFKYGWAGRKKASVVARAKVLKGRFEYYIKKRGYCWDDRPRRKRRKGKG